MMVIIYVGENQAWLRLSINHNPFIYFVSTVLGFHPSTTPQTGRGTWTCTAFMYKLRLKCIYRFLLLILHFFFTFCLPCSLPYLNRVRMLMSVFNIANKIVTFGFTFSVSSHRPRMEWQRATHPSDIANG